MGWMLLYDALWELERQLGVSAGKAQAALVAACGSGAVRSQSWAPEGAELAIPPSCWTPAVTFDLPGCAIRQGVWAATNVEIDGGDLICWIEDHIQAREAVPSEPSPVAAAQPGRARQREAARAALEAIWGDEAPTGTLKSITQAINEYREDKGLGPIRRDTIRRALDDRKAGLAKRRG
jgi:hypothetical protein